MALSSSSNASGGFLVRSKHRGVCPTGKAKLAYKVRDHRSKTKRKVKR